MRLRFDKRETTPVWIRILIPVICILLSFVICGLVLLALKIDPFKAYGKMFSGAFGSASNLSESILQSLPLMLCGLGVAVSFKMNVNNIGAEGQFVMGAWAATAFACYIDGIPHGFLTGISRKKMVACAQDAAHGTRLGQKPPNAKTRKSTRNKA